MRHVLLATDVREAVMTRPMRARREKPSAGFKTLYADSERQPRVMGIPLHPMISGQPLRIKYLQRVITEIKSRERVRFATGSEIIDAYQRVA